MSACRTCAQSNRDMPQRVVVFINGDTVFHKLERGREAEGLIKAARFLLNLAEQQAAKETPTNG